ncbi:hypothetical protein J4558_19845 [Leptolyngbya sp. 15MV]|nr:hypothetical protein J4558_19845 [Leptolyngbya sp. 15MV]
MLTLRALRGTPVLVPLRRPLGTSAMTVTHAPLMLIDLETEEGVTGHAYLFCYLRGAAQPAFSPKELAKQIQVMAQRPETLATAAHAAWNCGRPNAVGDLADLVESFGGDAMMDVIRVGGGEAQASGSEALA